MAATPQHRERPLSPHLQIFRPYLTMMMSIAHRITGTILFFGTLMLVWWLVSVASGPEAFARAQACFGSIPGKLVLFGYSWAMLHHMLGGLRHFIWDLGYGFDKTCRNALAQMTLWGGIILTLALWALVWLIRGGL